MKELSLYSIFQKVAQKYQHRPALKHKQNNRYETITYGELLDSVDKTAAALQQMGVEKGSKVGIFSYNRPEWVIADLAVLKLGAVVVPIYHNQPSPYVKYVINDSEITHIFIENAAGLAVFNSLKNETPTIKKIILFDADKLDPAADIILFDEIIKNQTELFINSNITGEDLATIVYTSGTTGVPKGVMLTHANIATNALSSKDRMNINENDVFLSFLPLCHMFERTCGCYVMLFSGGTIAYVENITTIAEDARVIRPTVGIAVPRVLEKINEIAEQTVQAGSWLKKALVQSAVKNLNQYANLKYRKEKIPLLLSFKCFFFNKLISAKFQKIAGGRLRMVITGGAPLNRNLAKILYIFGFNIIEGYGLTETSPVISCNAPGDNRLGTVGKPIDNVHVKIGENDEILVKGPNIMKGYYRKHEETAKIIDQDGWLHTGDQGKFDEYGNLVITGRIKEIIVTSYGKNIAPAPIEASLTKGQYITQTMIHGDNKKYLIALIVPDRDAISKYASENKIPYDDYQQLLESASIMKLIADIIEEVNKQLAPHEMIKKFVLVSEEFTIDNQLLTPTLKPRRPVIAQKYNTLIEKLYTEKKEDPNVPF